MLGLALAAKLQAAIIFPILLFLIAYRHIYIRHLLFIFLAYILSFLPAIALGRSVADIINIYLNQMGTYQELANGAPTFWAMFPRHSYQKFLPVALGMAGCITFIFTFVVLITKQIKSKTIFWDLAFLYALIVPYFLPKMHERYFYLAIVLSVIYLFKYPKRWFLVLGIILIDLFSYTPFLLGFSFMDIKWLSLAQLFIMISVVYLFLKEIPSREVSKDEMTIPQMTQKERNKSLRVKVCMNLIYAVCIVIIAYGTFKILNTPFNQGDSWRLKAINPFWPYWVSQIDKIHAKHSGWEEDLIKLSDKRIIRPSVADVAEIKLLNDKEMILNWNGNNEEHFIKNVKTGDYQFKKKE